MMVNRQDIVEGLHKLGLRIGDVVIVHSSLSSFGKVDGGADTVVDALLDVIGEQGTLIVPTFNAEPGIFDIAKTPSLSGAITEAVRKRDNAIRSNHPTHSVAAIGQLADVITEDHDKVHPFARGSAFFKALQANAKILQLGITHTSNSMIHLAEEIQNVPYLDRQRYVGIKTKSGKIIHKWIRQPGCSRGFDALDEPLEIGDQIKETPIGDCRARLMTARTVVEAAIELLKSDPEALLCSRFDCGVCAESRAMIAALETERQDKEVIELAEQEEKTIRLLERSLDGVEIKFFEPDRLDRSPN